MRGLALATLPVLEGSQYGAVPCSSTRSRWRFTVMSFTTMAARCKAAVPSARGSRRGSFGGPTHISEAHLDGDLLDRGPRRGMSPIRHPISPAGFARQQGCRPIDGS